jgi:AbiV family abortive infection protein
MAFLRWRLLGMLRATPKVVDEKLAAYKTVVNELQVVIDALLDDLPEDARWAVWNIRVWDRRPQRRPVVAELLLARGVIHARAQTVNGLADTSTHMGRLPDHPSHPRTEPAMTNSNDRPVPPTDDLVQLIRESLFNARDLLGSARLLLAHDQAGQAHALATLAFEEIGKSCICIIALVPIPPAASPFPTPKHFWKALNRHEDKLTWARGVFSLLITEPTGPVLEIVERLNDDARAAHLVKLRGLYVDYEDDHVQTPRSIPHEDAERLIADVQVALDFNLEAWDHDEVSTRLQEMQAYSAELEGAFDRIGAAINADADGIMAEARELVRTGGVPEAEPDAQHQTSLR